jgi:hypothetical protein
MFSISGRDSADGPVRARAWGTAGSSGVMPDAGIGRAASVGWLGSSMSITVLLRMMVSGMFTARGGSAVPPGYATVTRLP